jgi:hypothetical protein
MCTAEPFSQEKLLIDSWDEACRPLLDDRPEVVAWYEERRIEARNALIEFRKQNGNSSATDPATTFQRLRHVSQ